MTSLCRALYSFMEEIGEQRSICMRNRDFAAIHSKGKELGIYRMYTRSEEAISHLRDASNSLASWEHALLHEWEGENWETVKKQIDRRVERHQKLETVVSRGVAWRDRPVCIHAYKFEAEPIFKVELEMLGKHAQEPERALKVLAEALECHDYLLPPDLSQPQPPYTKHEAAFLTIEEYLSDKLPPDLYSLYASSLSAKTSFDQTPSHSPEVN